MISGKYNRNGMCNLVFGDAQRRATAQVQEVTLLCLSVNMEVFGP
jgi:hypothetical protein